MNLTELLALRGFDPTKVLVFRHRPQEPELRKVFPWLAAEKPTVFNAYQQTHSPKLEGAMQKLSGDGYVASFIGHEPGWAAYVGLYAIRGFRPISYDEYWRVPAYVEMKAFGMNGWSAEGAGRDTVLWFDLEQVDFYREWQGKLVVGWPPPERSWWRRAHQNDFPVSAVLEESLFTAALPSWDELQLTWAELQVIPSRLKAVLSQWRGIYYIFDPSDAKGYVGSAYGEANILGRWLSYAAKGDGGNVQLRKRSPAGFRFTILQRVSPDMEVRDVVRLENTWKERLHTRTPFGLNDN